MFWCQHNLRNKLLYNLPEGVGAMYGEHILDADEEEEWGHEEEAEGEDEGLPATKEIRPLSQPGHCQDGYERSWNDNVL